MLTESFVGDYPAVQLVSRSRSIAVPEPAGLDERIDAAPIRAIAAKEHVFTEGDYRCHLYRVEYGTICLYKILPDGRRQVLGFAHSGDLFGFGPAGPFGFNAQATGPARVRCLSWSAIERGTRRNPALALMLCELTARELAGIPLFSTSP